jgi:hypothetical protein
MLIVPPCSLLMTLHGSQVSTKTSKGAMRPAPEFARGQLAGGISVERTANAANNSTGRRHDGIMALFACICGVSPKNI